MDRLMVEVSGGKRRRRHKSRVRQFYSDFNSSSSMNSSEDEESKITQADIFTFDQVSSSPNGLKLPPEGNEGLDDGVMLSSERNHINRGYSARPLTPREGGGPAAAFTAELPLSPGVTPNQYLKDKAYELIYQHKIKDLRSNELSASNCIPISKRES